MSSMRNELESLQKHEVLGDRIEDMLLDAMIVALESIKERNKSIAADNRRKKIEIPF